MSKKQDIRNIILFVLIGLLLFGVVGYKAYNDFFADNTPDKKLMSLDLYGYTLTKTDTAIYKDNFKALEKVLNEQPINYEEYAKYLSKLFIIDVFTLSNKRASTDIGGLEFIHHDLRENFKENMGNTLYKIVETNLDGNRTQDLIEVASVDVSDVIETKYKYGDQEYDAYLVKLTWTYTKETDYQKSISLTLIKDNNFLYIVKGE